MISLSKWNSSLKAARKFALPTASILTAALALGLWYLVLDKGGAEQVRQRDTAFALTEGGDAVRGARIIQTVGCGSCHEIPGISAATGTVGPSLAKFKNQSMIAGVLKNSSENLIQWIRDPRKIDPATAMPNLGLSESEARDVAAFIYSIPD